MRLGVLPAGVRDRLAMAELTYHEVGATAGDLPAGYHQLTRSVPIGRGHRVFAAAGDAVCRWQVQLGAGLQVSASAPAAVAGAVVILGLGIGPLRLRAPCRIVYAVDEPHRRGFAYGTLAGHPESGEEAFMIQHHDDDTVSFKITAFSRPATRLAKVAGPAAGVVQRQITTRYLRALVKIVGLQVHCDLNREPPRRPGGRAFGSLVSAPIRTTAKTLSACCCRTWRTCGQTRFPWLAGRSGSRPGRPPFRRLRISRPPARKRLQGAGQRKAGCRYRFLAASDLGGNPCLSSLTTRGARPALWLPAWQAPRRQRQRGASPRPLPARDPKRPSPGAGRRTRPALPCPRARAPAPGKPGQATGSPRAGTGPVDCCCPVP